MLAYEELDANTEHIRSQLDRFLDFNDKNAQPANNKDWLADLNYINFLREIGSHFSVNRMLSFEDYKARLETGLSFIEFNYQLLQSYDFLELYRRYGCRLQIGGDDQWENIVAGGIFPPCPRWNSPSHGLRRVTMWRISSPMRALPPARAKPAGWFNRGAPLFPGPPRIPPPSSR
jgi:hypothetical protein